MAPPRRKRYTAPGDGEGYLTPSELKRLSRSVQKEVMSIWFHENFEDPVHCCPHDSGEGGYQYIYGGPYQAHEVLEGEFGAIVRKEALDELADQLSDESYEWSGRDKEPDIDDYFFESLALSTGPLAEFDRSINDIRTLLKTPTPSKTQKQCLVRLLYANVITALEAYLSDFFGSAIVQYPELRRKFVETNPEFRAEKFCVSEIFSVWDGIEKKINQYLAEFLWHNLGRVKPMFKDSLGIRFPDDMADLFRAVLVRHDLVHRNGKRKEGDEHVLVHADVEVLIGHAWSLVTEIEKQWPALKPQSTASGEL